MSGVASHEDEQSNSVAILMSQAMSYITCKTYQNPPGSYQFLLGCSVLLLGLSETRLVGLLVGLGGLNPRLRRGRARHCD